jgi:hypothetical protein
MACLAICSAAVVAAGAFGPFAAELRTRRVVIVDEFGREVGFLAGANGQARLELHNLATRNSAVLAAEADSAVMLETVAGNRVRLFNKGQLSALEIRTAKGKLRALLGVSENDKPKIILQGSADTTVWQAPEKENSSDGEHLSEGAANAESL